MHKQVVAQWHQFLPRPIEKPEMRMRSAKGQFWRVDVEPPVSAMLKFIGEVLVKAAPSRLAHVGEARLPKLTEHAPYGFEPVVFCHSTYFAQGREPSLFMQKPLILDPGLLSVDLILSPVLFQGSSQAISKEPPKISPIVDLSWSIINRHAFRRISEALRHSELTAELTSAYEDCKEDDWDGHCANAVSRANYEAALEVARMLPFEIPKPDVTVEPAGVLAFEWYREQGKVFVVSVDESRKLTYAGLFDGNEMHGTELLQENRLPENILVHVRRLYR